MEPTSGKIVDSIVIPVTEVSIGGMVYWW